MDSSRQMPLLNIECQIIILSVLLFNVKNIVLMESKIQPFSETAEKLATLLTKMCLESTVVNSGEGIEVEIPPTRHDILLEYFNSCSRNLPC